MQEVVFFLFGSSIIVQSIPTPVDVVPSGFKKFKTGWQGCLKELWDSVVYSGLQCCFCGNSVCYNHCFSVIFPYLLFMKLKPNTLQCKNLDLWHFIYKFCFIGYILLKIIHKLCSQNPWNTHSSASSHWPCLSSVHWRLFQLPGSPAGPWL